MRILLIGEFSGLHTNLAAGLRARGHQVTLAASGDGFKKIKVDHLLISDRPGLLGKVDRLFRPLFDLRKYAGHDVVQFINPQVLGSTWWHRMLCGMIRGVNKKSVLLACGDDAVTLDGMLAAGMAYSWIAPCLAENGVESAAIRANLGQAALNKWAAEIGRYDGTIAMAYEYSLGYARLPNYRGVVPFPMQPGTLPAAAAANPGERVVFHGINRSAFKGTPIILAAFKALETKYAGKVRFVAAGGMPLVEYMQVLSSADIVVDQCHSYSYGMNALYALGLGKVVLSGAEPAALAALGVPPASCPVVNIRPDVEQIVGELSRLLDNPDLIVEKKAAARDYVARYHGAELIADRFISCWAQVGVAC